MVEQLGGTATPAIGFSMGAERLLLLMDALGLQPVLEQAPSIFVLATGSAALQRAMVLAESLRTDEGYRVVVNTAGGSLKSQFKKADKSGARLAVILGDDELLNHTVTVKDLRGGQAQETISQQALNPHLKSILG